MAKENKKFLPFSNWMYLLGGVVIICLCSWYVISWQNVKKQEKYMNSYLVSTNTVTMEVKKTSEINQIFQELPENYFVYVSYTGDENIYKLEKKLKTIIDDYGLHDAFYFVNVTDNLEDESLITELNDSLKTADITNVPCIVYYEHGVSEKVIVNKDGIFEAADFKELLLEYEFEKK